jgi:tetratricopeptide (TPR) repeat protein
MIKKLYLPLLLGGVVAVLSSCSSKIGELSSNFFTITPQVLEATGGKVPVTINGRFPESYFTKKAILEVTPVLKWDGGEAKGQSYVYQGENVKGNNQVISYKGGGNITLQESFDFIPPMAKSELFLEFVATIGSKVTLLPSIKLGDGVISTSTLFEGAEGTLVSDAHTAISSDGFQRTIKEAQQANILFLIQQANLRASELNSTNIKNFNKQVKDAYTATNKNVSTIEISSYASPDGGLDLNTKLAKERESNTKGYLNKQLKSSKINVPVDAKYTAEDWDGFQELVSQSNIQDKELILRVLSMYSDPEQREREIKNISSVYKVLADEILPQLRRSRLILNYEIIGKSDEEISQLAQTAGSQLSIEELLYAATLAQNNAQKEAIYNRVIQQFPNDYRAYNNLGSVYYKASDIAQAESLYKKAENIKAAPEVNLNLGLVALVKGDNAAAESYFSKAAGSEYLNEALGNLYISQGQYERAVSSFGNSKTNSAALAQILANDYNSAKNTLENVAVPNAVTDYLSAILGARTNNTSLLVSSLKKAVQKDASLAQKAASDIEFNKYRTISEFQEIVK